MCHNWTISEVLDLIFGPGLRPAAVHCCAESPFRPAFWRFAKSADRVADHNTSAIDALCNALKRIRRWHTEPMPAWGEAVLGDAAPLAAAVELAAGDVLPRAELEGRVLADQPCAEIAARLTVPPVVVAIYEYFFWDVRPYLAAGAWVRHHALRWDHAWVLPRRAVPLLWRLFGYRYGVTAMDWLTTGVSHELLLRDGVDAYFEPHVPIPVELKRTIAGMRLPIPKTPREVLLLELLQQLSDALVERERADQALNIALQWQVTEDRPLIIDDHVLALTRKYLREAA